MTHSDKIAPEVVVAGVGKVAFTTALSSAALRGGQDAVGDARRENILQTTTAAIRSSDSRQIGYFAQLKEFNWQRHAISAHMIQMMEASEFADITFNNIAANVHITLGQNLLASAH